MYHAQSRFGLRRIPHVDSGQPGAPWLDFAGFNVQLSRDPGFRLLQLIDDVRIARPRELAASHNRSGSCNVLSDYDARSAVRTNEAFAAESGGGRNTRQDALRSTIRLLPRITLTPAPANDERRGPPRRSHVARAK